MIVSAPVVNGSRLMIIVYASDVFYRASLNTSYPSAGPVASVLLSNVMSLSNMTSSNAPARIELITSKVYAVLVNSVNLLKCLPLVRTVGIARRPIVNLN